MKNKTILIRIITLTILILSVILYIFCFGGIYNINYIFNGNKFVSISKINIIEDLKNNPNNYEIELVDYSLLKSLGINDKIILNYDDKNIFVNSIKDIKIKAIKSDFITSGESLKFKITNIKTSKYINFYINSNQLYISNTESYKTYQDYTKYLNEL